MSNKKRETVADIVAEIRRQNPVLADRIKTAAKREDARTTQRFAMYAKVNERQDMDYIVLKEENARLRAALKPVLECKVMSAMTAEIGPGKSEYCANIIFKAQRIYNEGGEA